MFVDCCNVAVWLAPTSPYTVHIQSTLQERISHTFSSTLRFPLTASDVNTLHLSRVMHILLFTSGVYFIKISSLTLFKGSSDHKLLFIVHFCVNLFIFFPEIHTFWVSHLVLTVLHLKMLQLELFQEQTLKRSITLLLLLLGMRRYTKASIWIVAWYRLHETILTQIKYSILIYLFCNDDKSL